MQRTMRQRLRGTRCLRPLQQSHRVPRASSLPRRQTAPRLWWRRLPWGAPQQPSVLLLHKVSS